MSKLILTVFGFMVAQMVFAQVKKESEKIIWTEGLVLTWDNYKGIPDTGSQHAAITRCGVSFEIVKKKNDSCVFMVNAVMYPNGSWVKKKYLDRDDILRHEQGHFDIAEINARLFRKKLARSKFKKLEVEIDTKALWREMPDQLKKLQKKYDEKTTRPINARRQKKWDKKIKDWLEDLKAYSDPIVKIKFAE